MYTTSHTTRMPADNATARFSNRVADYIASRPGYPPEVVQYLQDVHGWHKGMRLLDLGCGTGLSALPFLHAGYEVVGIEPNAEMLSAGNQLLVDFPRFSSRLATADKTALEDNDADVAIAGQAFHWFDREATRNEMLRVLRANAKGQKPVALLFNDRRTDSTPFLRDYEALLQSLEGDYAKVDHKNVHGKGSSELAEFFDGAYTETVFYNEQRFGHDGLVARVCSSSYAPSREDAAYPTLLKELRQLFNKHEHDGEVVWEYDCRVIVGSV
jgi:SAM-dependent methyltransferase